MPPILDVSNLRVGAQLVDAAYYGSTLLGGGFNPQSVVLEGDNWILRTAGLTGVSNSSVGSVSFNAELLFDDTVDHAIAQLSSSSVYVRVDTSKRLLVRVSAGASEFRFRTSAPVTPSTAAKHFAVSWNTNFAAGLKVGQIYIDGVAAGVEVTSDTAAAFSGTLAGQYLSIGATNAGALKGTFVLSEFLYWPGAFIDWSDPENIAKVYNGSGPVNPGDNGELVTGTAPAVYLALRGDGAASTFLTNRGTGGDMDTAVGRPVIRADTPFIPYGDSLVFGTASTIYPDDTWVYKTTRGLNTKRRRYNYGVGGEGTSAIRTRFVAAIGDHVTKFGSKAIYLLEGGYNSLAGNVQTGILDQWQLMVNAILSADPAAKFLAMGIANRDGTDQEIGGAVYDKIIAANSGISAMVGASRFIDIRQWLVDNGLSAAGLSATAEDLTDISLGVVPRSLRSAAGDPHWNNRGQVAVWTAVQAKIQTLGWD